MFDPLFIIWVIAVLSIAIVIGIAISYYIETRKSECEHVWLTQYTNFRCEKGIRVYVTRRVCQLCFKVETFETEVKGS